MMLRKLTDGGPWEVAAFVDTNGVCAFLAQLELLFGNPVTARVACCFWSQFNLIVQRGPFAFAEEVFEQLSDSIYAFKRDRFRVVGFLVEKRFVACTIIKLAGRTRRLEASVVTDAERELARYLRHEQDLARAPFVLTRQADS